jgi:hypothetical protein
MKMRRWLFVYFLEMIRVSLQVVCTVVLAVSAVLEACAPDRAERGKQASNIRVTDGADWRPDR